MVENWMGFGRFSFPLELRTSRYKPVVETPRKINTIKKKKTVKSQYWHYEKKLYILRWYHIKICEEDLIQSIL